MKIIYYLLTHKNQRQIHRLVNRLLFSRNSFVLIHHDFSNDVKLSDVNNHNFHVIPDYVPVRWGDISVVQAMLKGLEWLESEQMDFDWIIFLSGQDYPIKPLNIIESDLSSTQFDAFIHYEEINKNQSLHSRAYRTLCMHRYFYYNIKLIGHKRIYLQRRHPYVGGLRCFAGSQWLNLSRKAVRSLMSNRDLISKLLNYLKDAECPDETFFQTILLNDPDLHLSNDDKRFILWSEDSDHPETLSMSHLEAMLGSTDWFARKIDDEICPELLDRLDQEANSSFESLGMA